MFAPIQVAAVDIDVRDWCGDCMENSVTYDAMNDERKRRPILLMNHMQRKCPIYPLTHPANSSDMKALHWQTVAWILMWTTWPHWADHPFRNVDCLC